MNAPATRSSASSQAIAAELAAALRAGAQQRLGQPVGMVDALGVARRPSRRSRRRCSCWPRRRAPRRCGGRPAPRPRSAQVEGQSCGQTERVNFALHRLRSSLARGRQAWQSAANSTLGDFDHADPPHAASQLGCRARRAVIVTRGAGRHAEGRRRSWPSRSTTSSASTRPSRMSSPTARWMPTATAG